VFGSVKEARHLLEGSASELDAERMLVPDVDATIDELARIIRLAHGMVGKLARRQGDAKAVARALHVSTSEVRSAVEKPKARRERLHKQRSFRIGTDAEGMVSGSFRLTPEIGGQVKAKFDAAVQKIFRDHKSGDHEPHETYAADAFAAFVLDGAGGKPKTTVHVVIDHGALMRGGPVEGEVCEIPGVGPVDVAWVKEILGESFLTAVIKNGKDISTVAHLGRHVPAEVMTALIVNGRECCVEGCYNRGYLERDHRHEYVKGGPTSYANLGYFCFGDHDKKTKGWILGEANPITGKRTLTEPPDRGG
jgi:hypothetical protein